MTTTDQPEHPHCPARIWTMTDESYDHTVLECSLPEHHDGPHFDPTYGVEWRQVADPL